MRGPAAAPQAWCCSLGPHAPPRESTLPQPPGCGRQVAAQMLPPQTPVVTLRQKRRAPEPAKCGLAPALVRLQQARRQLVQRAWPEQQKAQPGPGLLGLGLVPGLGPPPSPPARRPGSAARPWSGHRIRQGPKPARREPARPGCNTAGFRQAPGGAPAPTRVAHRGHRKHGLPAPPAPPPCAAAPRPGLRACRWQTAPADANRRRYRPARPHRDPTRLQ
ncbi:MAG: hypothetical protein RI920_421 [Pseudomonadota bacterium]